MEQKLIDIMFQLTITAAMHPWFRDKTRQEISEWIVQQLQLCDITVVPVGSSYMLLKGK